MRRKDREMPAEFAYSVIDRSPYGTLATLAEDGTPYCIPVSAVRRDKAIYFHCAHEGAKIQGMRAQPRVCLSFVSYAHIPKGKFTSEYESAVVFGLASEVTDPAEKTEILRWLCLRYTPDNMDDFYQAIARSLDRTAIWQVNIDTITGKRKKYDSAGVEMKFGRME